MKCSTCSGIQRFAVCFMMSLAAASTVSTAAAQTEFHFQAGKLRNPFAQKSVQSLVLTVQQATQWKLGDSFFFLDYIVDRETDGFNDRDFYAEWYPTLSIGKMQQTDASLGLISDLAIIAGINMGGDAKVLKFLPGFRAS